MRLLFCLLAAIGLPLAAQAPTWEVGTQYVPSSATVVRSVNSHITQLDLDNTSGSAVQVTLTDLTGCGGSGCILFQASVPADTYWAIPMNGQKANGGFSWVAATGSVVTGHIKGNY